MRIIKPLGFIFILFFFSCTAPYQQQGPATGPGGIESALREYLASSPEVLIVKDKGGTFWAVPPSSVEEIVGNAIHISSGTLLILASGENATDQQIGESLASRFRNTSSVGFFYTEDESGKVIISGTSQEAPDNAAIRDVVKLIRVK